MQNNLKTWNAIKWWNEPCKNLNRIHELGGKPTTDLMGSSTCGLSPPPDDPHDLNRIIELVLKGVQLRNTMTWQKISH